MTCRTGAISCAVAFSNFPLSVSGPAALLAFRFSSSFSTPIADTFRILRLGYCLFNCGRFLVSSSVNTEENCALSISAFCCGLVALLPSFFKTVMPVLSFLNCFTYLQICSATSNRQLGHHEVSTVVSNLYHPGCYCIQEVRNAAEIVIKSLLEATNRTNFRCHK